MKLPFRHGIVDAQKNGLGQPQFILLSSTPGYLQLSATSTATTIAVAHGTADYLFTFNQNVDPAWGPLTPGVNNYLYWNVDVQTAAITYGITTLEPVTSTVEPLAPQIDQHWFDLNTTMMKVWNGQKWQVKIRLFAGMIPNGNTATDPSTWCYPLYQPSAVASALMVESTPGYVMTNMFGQPLYVSGATLQFLTAKTQVRVNSTVGTAGVLSQPTNAVFPVKAGENIPKMSVVYFSGENQVGLASGNPSVNPPKIPIGIVQNELATGEVGILHQNGEISSDSWDWSAHIGRPLYCGDFGDIITNRPSGLLAYRIGFVKNRNTIIFQVDAETLPQIYQLGNSDVVVNGDHPIDTVFSTNGLGERIWTVSMPAASSTGDGYMTQAQAAALNQHEVRLDQAELDIANRSLLGHTHAISDVAGLQVALDSKALLGHTHSEYALLAHTHSQYAPLVHTHTIPDVAGLQTELSSKAPLIHTHVAADITDLATLLNGKIDKQPSAVTGNFAAFTADGGITDSSVNMSTLSTTFAFSNHTHSIAHVTGLQAALDGKAAVTHDHNTQYAQLGHTHALNDLTDADTATTPPIFGDALVWNGSNWVPGAVQAAPALPTQVVFLGSIVQGMLTLRTAQADMTYWSNYMMDQFGYLTAWGGVWDQSTSGTGITFPTALDIDFPLPADANGVGAIATVPSTDVAPEVMVEVVVNEVPTGTTEYFIGAVYNPFTFPDPPSASFVGNNVAANLYRVGISSTATSMTSVGGAGAGQVTYPPLQVGDVIGLMFQTISNSVRVYRNGVFVEAVPAFFSEPMFVMVGARAVSLT